MGVYIYRKCPQLLDSFPGVSKSFEVGESCIMLQRNLLIMRNKLVLSLKFPSRIHFIKNRSDCCCPACLASGNKPEECSLGLIRWEWKEKSFLKQILDFRETRLCSVRLFDCRDPIHPLMSQNDNLTLLCWQRFANECPCTLGFILRSVRAAGVVQQVLWVAANQTPSACNPEIKGRTELFWRIIWGIKMLIWNVEACNFLFVFSADPQHFSFPLSQVPTFHASLLGRECFQLSTLQQASIP